MQNCYLGSHTLRREVHVNRQVFNTGTLVHHVFLEGKNIFYGTDETAARIVCDYLNSIPRYHARRAFKHVRAHSNNVHRCFGDLVRTLPAELAGAVARGIVCGTSRYRDLISLIPQHQRASVRPLDDRLVDFGSREGCI